MSAQLYEEEKKKQEETGSVCTHCSSIFAPHSRRVFVFVFLSVFVFVFVFATLVLFLHSTLTLHGRRGSDVVPATAIPKTFFGKARTKNKVHKLPGEKAE